MIKKIVRFIFLYLGPWQILRILERRKYGAGISILYGHRVMTDEVMSNPDDPRVVTGHTSVSEVECAIKTLSKHYEFISIGDAVEQIKSGQVKKESVVLTFDDGFRDNFVNLLPVLKKYNVPATFYINASVIGSNKNLWFQAVINYFYAIKEDKIFIDENQTEYDLSSSKKRYQAAFDFMQYIQNNKHPTEFYSVIEKLAGDKCLPSAEDFHMTWDDLKQLADEPLITLGAHSYRHFPLGYCDEELSEYEIKTSIEKLEQELEMDIKHFSFPRGHREDFNDFHIKVLRENGIDSATTTLRGVNRNGQDLYEIKRIGFPQNISNDVEEFLWYVGGIPQIIAKMKSSR